METAGREPNYNQPSFEHRRSSELGMVEKNLHALKEFYENPIENDPRISAYRQAMIEMLLAEDPVAIKALETLYEGNPKTYNSPDTPAIYATNLYLRFLQKVLMQPENCPEGFRYPHDFTNAETWKEGIRHVSQQKVAEAELIMCSAMSIQSNVADRYKSLKLLLNGTEGRFSDSPLVLDIGSSQKLGPNVMVKKDATFFSLTVVAEVVDRPDVRIANIQAKIGAMLIQEVDIGEIRAVDVFTPDDPFIKNWIKACSLYPSELMIRKLVEYYDELSDFTSERIKFVLNDFAEPWEHKPNRSTAELPKPGTVDCSALITILYQAPMEDRKKILARAYDSLSEDGLLLVQDFVVVHEEKPYELDFSPWHKRSSGDIPADEFPYKAFVWDKKNPEAGFQPFLSWSNGRCHTVRLEEYALKELKIGI